MAIFNNQQTATKPASSFEPGPAPVKDVSANTDFAPAQPPVAPRAAPAPAKESVIAADLTIEGKIEGSGHVRIAGRFKGDVNVQGDLTIENGARLNGGVRAKKVIVAGDLEGNIDSAQRVELLDSAVLTGDLKAGSLTVAAGAKIRGHIESGWGDGTDAPKGGKDTGAKADLDLAS